MSNGADSVHKQLRKELENYIKYTSLFNQNAVYYKTKSGALRGDCK